MPETIKYQTFDGINIVGDWTPVPTTVGVVVFLHMMPNDRKSWAPFAQVLSKYNVASLAIDMRGHGESTTTINGDRLDYKKFSDAEHQKYLNDAIGAVEWLVAKKYPKKQIMIVGASIGANVSLWMLRQEPLLAGAVLLSPGDYRGIDATEEAEYVKPHQSVWAAGSDSDDPEAYEAAKALIGVVSSERKAFVPYKNAGHGVHLFTSDPKLMENLAVWIKESLSLPRA